MTKRIVTTLLLSVCMCICTYAQTEDEDRTDYSSGVFVLNEDWYGHNNSTMNFLTNEGKWIYRVIQKENPGSEIGCSACYSTIYGGRCYIISKQSTDGGSSVQGGRITICDAGTMKIIKQIDTIDDNGSVTDGRGFAAINNEKAYVGTNNGIYILDLNSLEIKGKIEGSENENKDPYGKIYRGQTGTILRINEKVYALHQDKGLLTIDPESDRITAVNAGPDNGSLGYGSAVMSKDGSLWLSVSDKMGSGKAYDFLIKYNPATGDTLRVNIPEGINAPANSWYAWTPDGFCASTQNNVLYWNSGQKGWFSNNHIYRYDIDRNEFSLFADFSSENLNVYGCSMRMDPSSDIMYVSLNEDPAIPYFVMRTYDNKGGRINEYPLIDNFWFPSIPMFPDKEMPVAKSTDTYTHTGNDAFMIDLSDIAYDGDNMSAAMVKTIREISDRNVADASIVNGNLYVKPIADGNTTIVIDINSNGHSTSADIALNIKECSGIDDTPMGVKSAYAEGNNVIINNCKGFAFTAYDASGSVLDRFDVTSDIFSRRIERCGGLCILKGVSHNGGVTFKLCME